MVAERKRKLLGNLHGDILEIGAGTAPNLAYYPTDINWLGIDPNPAMFTYAEQEARRVGRPIELREGAVEQLPVPDNSMDVVVSTLVLCSVSDPQQALQEVIRVLKPGGQFVFLEHVAAARQTRLRRIQRVIRPAWRLFCDGCHPDRETWEVIRNAGFRHVQIEHFRVDVAFVEPHISGFAVK